MSALPPKADIRPRDQDVCFGDISQISPLNRSKKERPPQIGERLRNGLNEQYIDLNYQATADRLGLFQEEFS
jgi:hypothetical protein